MLDANVPQSSKSSCSMRFGVDVDVDASVRPRTRKRTAHMMLVKVLLHKSPMRIIVIVHGPQRRVGHNLVLKFILGDLLATEQTRPPSASSSLMF